MDEYMHHSFREALPILRQPIVLILFLDFPADLVFRTNSPIARDDNLLGCENLIAELMGRAYIFLLHGREFLKFILSVVNVDLEHVVGLLLDFFFPLGPTQR